MVLRHIRESRKDTFSVAKIPDSRRNVKQQDRQAKRRRARRVRIGTPDARLTPAAGVETVRELDRVLGLTSTLDTEIGPVKGRARGLTSGEVLVSMASAQLAGTDFMVGLDRRREDLAGQFLEPVSTPASTTWAANAKRFTTDHFNALPAALRRINTRFVSHLPRSRQGALLRNVTIDGDATDVEVYGRSKEGAAHAYTGALTLRPHIAHWAEAGVPLAAELMGGTEDPRANAVEILDRALQALPEGVGQVSVRWDAGYFAASLATACVERGLSFAIGAKRVKPLMVAATQASPEGWVPAIGMEHAEVAVIDYLPGSWPDDAGIACIARRTRIPVERIPTAQARKRRTIPADQLALALEGKVDAVYGYSFILTNLPLADLPDIPEDEAGLRVAEVEYWYRHRTDIEALNKDAKHGAALRHLPSANKTINTVWMHAALLGCAIAAWMQELAGTDNGNGRGRFTVTRFRREIIQIPARLTRRAGNVLLRLPPGTHLLEYVLARLQGYPASSG